MFTLQHPADPEQIRYVVSDSDKTPVSGVFLCPHTHVPRSVQKGNKKGPRLGSLLDGLYYHSPQRVSSRYYLLFNKYFDICYTASSKKETRGCDMTKDGLPQFYRQRYLLAVLHTFGGKLQRTDFLKYLFLAAQEYELSALHYSFLPYKFGPFSFQAYTDLRRLSELGYLHFDETISLISPINYTAILKEQDARVLAHLHEHYHLVSGKALIASVYTKYPYYTLNSTILSEVFDSPPPTLERNSAKQLFTIGYEGRSIDQYLDTLIQENITTVFDVRKNPVSMKYGFSKTTLQKALTNISITYIHTPELGIESSERKHLHEKHDYTALFDRYEKEILPKNDNALNSIIERYEGGNRVALTCFERDETYCHRSRISASLDRATGCCTKHI